MSDSEAASNVELGSWDRFWFAPASISWSALIRGLFAFLTLVYFVSCWSDAAYWYTGDGVFAPSRVATFLKTSGLEEAAVWIVSPLFFAESVWAYHLYLAAGVSLALVVMCGRGGRWSPWLLWLLLIGWANRTMILSGLAETTLSLGLFASAFAPPCSAVAYLSDRHARGNHWSAGFSQRLLATQATIVFSATFATMLGGRVWFNGLGAYALAAPASDRTIDWTSTFLVNVNVHEGVTHLLVIALPLGLLMAWNRKLHRTGLAILLVWCVAIMLLGSLWLYGLTLAVMALSIQPFAQSVSTE